MRVPIFQVDAFTDRPLRGNPAAVMVLPAFPGDEALRAIARENNLAETAFLVRDGDAWRLRWFTPKVEVPLCGHGTLAAAWVISNRIEPGAARVAFHTASGVLTVTRLDDRRFTMDLPARAISAVASPPPSLDEALGARSREVLHDGFNYVALLSDAQAVRALSPDMRAIAALPGAVGVIVSAAGDGGYDCVSRYFAPAKGVDEDPVTGGAHCALTPLWCARLGKSELRAYQASARGGELVCRARGARVAIDGACAFYMEGEAEIGIDVRR